MAVIEPVRWGWIGVDLDGTLALDSGHVTTIGAPVPLMVARVKRWLAEGWTVKIFTARAARTEDHTYEPYYDKTADTFHAEQDRMIRAWCLEHLGQELEITATKDFQMVQLWDDRVIQVIHNTGEPVLSMVVGSGDPL